MIYDSDVRTLAALPEVQARRYPERIALTCEDRSLSYAAFAEQCAQLTAALRQRGLGAGARVGLLSKDSIEAVVLLFAAAACGATVVPINWRLSPAEVAFIVSDAECTLLFTSAELRASTASVPESCTVASLGNENPAAALAPATPAPQVEPGDIAVQVYTSGTTGLPKGVQLAHDSFFAIAREFFTRKKPWIGWSEGDVSLCTLPLFHVGGLWWLVRVLASGSHAVLLPQFVGWRAIEAIERHGVTKIAVVPAMLHVILSEPDAKPERFASLRVVGYGGSPAPAGLIDRARAFFGCEFHQVYGLTETGNMAVSLSPTDHDHPKRRTSVGKALPGVTLKIIDENGASLAPGAVGEVCIKSPAVMIGYWRNAAATAAALEAGWVKTGDAGYLDEDGYLYICDRLKDMVCCAGEKVWPAEVEQVLAEHPAVREIAIIGVPHADWGEAVRAVVARRGDTPLELRELRAFARGRLADFKLPSSLELVDALPRTPAGKVQKKLLRDTFMASTTLAAG